MKYQQGQLVAILNIKTGQTTTGKVMKITSCFITVRLLPPSSLLVKINLKTSVDTGIDFYYMLIK